MTLQKYIQVIQLQINGCIFKDQTHFFSGNHQHTLLRNFLHVHGLFSYFTTLLTCNQLTELLITVQELTHKKKDLG